MIITSIVDQLKYVDRCVNPDYIIIVQNKAGEMDFSQFKIVRPEEKVEIQTLKRFVISIDEFIDDNGKHRCRIKVKDNFERRIVLDIECKKEKQEARIINLKRTYNTRSVLKEI